MTAHRKSDLVENALLFVGLGCGSCIFQCRSDFETVRCVQEQEAGPSLVVPSQEEQQRWAGTGYVCVF